MKTYSINLKGYGNVKYISAESAYIAGKLALKYVKGFDNPNTVTLEIDKYDNITIFVYGLKRYIVYPI